MPRLRDSCCHTDATPRHLPSRRKPLWYSARPSLDVLQSQRRPHQSPGRSRPRRRLLLPRSLRPRRRPRHPRRLRHRCARQGLFESRPGQEYGRGPACQAGVIYQHDVQWRAMDRFNGLWLGLGVGRLLGSSRDCECVQIWTRALRAHCACYCTVPGIELWNEYHAQNTIFAVPTT